MGALVGLLGLAGLGLAAAMLVVRFIFKKGLTYKNIGVLAGVALALFIVGLIITPSAKESFNAGREAGQQAAMEADSVSSSEPSSLDDEVIEADDLITSERDSDKPENAQEQHQTVSPPEGPDPEDSIPEDDENTPDTIPGLTAADIKLNLQQTWGLEFSGPRPGEDLAQDTGQTVDYDTGVKLICNIFETTPMHVLWVDFVVNASLVAGSIGVEEINAVTEGYFGYCSTVPYEDAEPDKAKQWVEENVEKATKPGNVLSTQIGSVQFEMFGTEYFRTLRIKPVTK